MAASIPLTSGCDIHVELWVGTAQVLLLRGWQAFLILFPSFAILGYTPHHSNTRDVPQGPTPALFTTSSVCVSTAVTSWPKGA